MLNATEHILNADSYLDLSKDKDLPRSTVEIFIATAQAHATIALALLKAKNG